MPQAYVIGLGKSGNAAARLLKSQGWQVTVSDRGQSDRLQAQAEELRTEGIEVALGDHFDSQVSQPELVIVSPGVPWDVPSLVKARSIGVVAIGEMELAWRNLRNQPWLAITGTNGKTTTTALTAAIFQAAGLHAPAFGNIGYAACEMALLDRQPDWCVAELSSYQIESSPSVAPQIGIWTTFTPDHLVRHKTMPNYYEMKARLLARSQWQIFNGDDPYLRNIGLQQGYPVKANACWTSVQGRSHLVGNPEFGIWIESNQVIFQGEAVIAADALRMPGDHNLQNLLMAVAAAKIAGINNAAIDQAIRNFPGVEHRLEHIITWKGIDFINDSKATNYDAAEVGLHAVKAPTLLIAGGEPKEGDDTAWLSKIKQKAVKVLLIGQAAEPFAQRLAAVGYDAYEMVHTLDQAIARSADLAPELGVQVVLFSPACASFDQYDNFEQRGDHFRQLCLQRFGE
ncbi:MAG: UDP-N-acetylmuramoyl-L-alanine--D-glutamate ligase [Synechococcales bacterium]|nr:UDP-N-acetylmuramoyl-L-alanine--D-glutamate ligase [Synechococcales bacterium]